MKVHELKIETLYFKEILSGRKNFEIRKDDRNYEVGDKIVLKELKNGEFTGREIKDIIIKYILRNVPDYGLKEGYCILGFNRIKKIYDFTIEEIVKECKAREKVDLCKHCKFEKFCKDIADRSEIYFEFFKYIENREIEQWQ